MYLIVDKMMYLIVVMAIVLYMVVNWQKIRTWKLENRKFASCYSVNKDYKI